MTREQLVAYFGEHSFDTATWDLVRHRVVSEYSFEVGNEPGVVLFIDVDSEAEARKIVESLPVVAGGLLTFELDP